MAYPPLENLSNREVCGSPEECADGHGTQFEVRTIQRGPCSLFLGRGNNVHLVLDVIPRQSDCPNAIMNHSKLFLHQKSQAGYQINPLETELEK